MNVQFLEREEPRMVVTVMQLLYDKEAEIFRTRLRISQGKNNTNWPEWPAQRRNQ